MTVWQLAFLHILGTHIPVEMRQYVKSLVIVILAIAFGISCEKEEEKNPETDFIEYNTSHGEIGGGGGSVTIIDPESETNGASIIVPDGALDGIENISIQIDNSIRPPGDSVSDIIRLEPDGLSFSTPVTIKVPVDNSVQYPSFFYFDPDSSILRQIPIIEHNKEDEYITVQVSHFSRFFLGLPSKLTDYYYQNRNQGYINLPVPYYVQEGKWCSFYALNMVTKFAGYSYKAPWLAKILNTYGGTSTEDGYIVGELLSIRNDLALFAGITVDFDRYWTNVTNMCGMILYELKNGHPVVVFSPTTNHAIVVTGFDEYGFRINDPADLYSIGSRSTYNDFEKQFGGNRFGAEHTVIIESSGNESREGYTLNFRNADNLWIRDQFDALNDIGQLELNQLFSPNGYAIVNIKNRDVGFNGSDYLFIAPDIANSHFEKAELMLLVKIDNVDIDGSPHSFSIKSKHWKISDIMSTQLSNLTKGNHRIDVELRSLDSKILYDSWSFSLRIENEYNVFPPVADFQASSTIITEGQSVQFTDQSTTSPTSWSWDFGDGESSTEQNPSHTFNTAGIFTVTLAASNDHGSNTETKTNYITVNEIGSPPVADFTASKTVATINEEIKFTDQSTNNPTSWSWDFGDGGSSTEQNPSHTFAVDGSYTVSLSATNEFGSDLIEIENYIIVTSEESCLGCETGTFTDLRDGNEYSWVKIGHQIWMAENLAYLPTISFNINNPEYYKDPIHFVYDYHGNNVEEAKNTYNYKEYGVLYNIKAASQGCPDGWHLSTDDDWKELEMYLGISPSEVHEESNRGINEGHMLKEVGTEHWKFEDPYGRATNESGFTALPGGLASISGDTINSGGLGKYGYWWATVGDDYYNPYRMLYPGGDIIRWENGPRDFGFAVRCVKD